MDTNNRDEFLELCESVREQTISEADWHRLEKLLQDQELRRLYTDYMAMAGQLGECLEDFGAARGGDPDDARQMMLDALLERNARSAQATVTRPTKRRWMIHVAYATALSVLAMLLWRGLGTTDNSKKVAFASISMARDCKWGAGTLPTVVGSRLNPGRLDLLEGFAKIDFDNGVQLSLEAPTSVTLESLTDCEVHSGQMLAHVPGAEIGFTVTTPTTEVLDLGTEFAVRVEDDGRTGVHVLSGEVNITNLRSNESQRLLEREIAEVGKKAIARPDVDVEGFGTRADDPGDELKDRESRLISTAQGSGRDAFIWRERTRGYEGPEMLLVKHCVAHRDLWDRKVYLAFDIESLKGFKLDQAELRLHLVPSGLGYVSGQLDSTFQVYGLIDESLDDWSEKTINWQNAPANETGAASVASEMTVPVGSFEVRQGVQTGSVSVSGDRLRDFIESDTNGVITLIVVRETRERAWDGGGLVHAFMSKEHPSGLPPTLRLTGTQESDD
ncbi:FecR protein [Stieleria neptunia]|uniref:FecR protein n=1 Tax=Stieleria neptunia TaxID=2527979 RepID=A0A518HIC5_9BACT|nr:DNRLRE domain-containing protein [Stieleria neptunia]QDV40604.1 FecR protein [Stieleria neptunia]